MKRFQLRAYYLIPCLFWAFTFILPLPVAYGQTANPAPNLPKTTKSTPKLPKASKGLKKTEPEKIRSKKTPLKLPDLRVRLRVKTEYRHSTPKSPYYNVTVGYPIFSITNIGDIAASKFAVHIHWCWAKFSQPCHWSLASISPSNGPLSPGQSVTVDEYKNALIGISRADGSPERGFRVTVDPGNKVFEKNESNNTATAMF